MPISTAGFCLYQIEKVVCNSITAHSLLQILAMDNKILVTTEAGERVSTVLSNYCLRTKMNQQQLKFHLS